ncbi:MAG TPA: hypothetical protein VN317_09255 [Candidatus Methanoperedens sp.]|nr:hypothetical protein [Candidatus Methanoperedens sp.]
MTELSQAERKNESLDPLLREIAAQRDGSQTIPTGPIEMLKRKAF